MNSLEFTSDVWVLIKDQFACMSDFVYFKNDPSLDSFFSRVTFWEHIKFM